MKMNERWKLIGISMMLVVGLAACDKPGPAESAGKTIDDTADAAGQKLGRAADKVEEAADKAAEKMGEKSDQARVALDDAEITARVKRVVYSEPGLKTLKISVDTVNGVVTLTGSVESQSNFDRVKALAEAVDGVKEVENYRMVKPTL
jgi:hyperosmotically inducible protein